MSRNWSLQSLGSASLVRRVYPGGTITNNSNIGGLVQHRKDVARPDISKTVKSRGWRPPMPWSVDDTDYWQWDGSLKYETKNVSDPSGAFSETTVSGLISGPGWLGGAPPSPVPYITPHGVNEENRVVTQALLNIRDVKFAAMTALAEVNKTTRTITDRMSKLTRAYRLAKSGKIAGACEVLGVSFRRGSQTWLELQYGWMPLLMDIHGAYEASRQRVIQDRMIVKGSSHFADDQKRMFNYAPPNLPVVLSVTEKQQRLTKCSMYYEYTNASLARASQLGLTNPVEVAWELVPGSFILDWILPVGDWLGAQTAAHGTVFRGGSVTKRVLSTRKGVMVARPPLMIGSTKITFLGGSARCEGVAKMVRRTVYTASPQPGLYLKNPFSGASRAVSALALFVEAFKK